MPDLFYPYANMQDAAFRIGRFVDRAVDRRCGITWSDGVTLTMLRKPQLGLHGNGTYFNVLRLHISAPPPAPPRPSTSSSFLARAEAVFWHAMELEGKIEIENSQNQLAASRAVVGAVRDNLWEPAHRYLLRHKLAADGVGVAVDVIGIIAGAAFLLAFAPELGVAAIVAGAAAGAGSVILLLADGSVFVPEMLGNEALSQSNEHSQAVQWGRIIGTGMTLIDIPYGGARALIEVGKLSPEAREALTGAENADKLAALARERVASIHHPTRHPGPVNRRMHKVKNLVRQADAQRQAASDLTLRMRVVAARDVTASFAATPTGTSLLVGAPPEMLLSKRQKDADENYLKLLEPAQGMPRDAKLEIRMSSIGKAART